MWRGGNSCSVDATIAFIAPEETRRCLGEETTPPADPDDWDCEGDEDLDLGSREVDAKASARLGGEGVVDLEVVGLLLNSLPC